MARRQEMKPDRLLAMAAVWTLLAASLAGCKEEQIAKYRVPKEPEVADAGAQKPATVRLLGVILPHEERVWFFKVMGPLEAVGEQEKAFTAFAQSVRFKKSPPPIEWTVPPGWRQEPGSSPLRYATFKIGSQDKELEMTVTQLGKEAASVIDNVNRWRGQIGLRPISAMELDQVSKPMKIGDIEATWVDMSGPGAKTRNR